MTHQQVATHLQAISDWLGNAMADAAAGASALRNQYDHDWLSQVNKWERRASSSLYRLSYIQSRYRDLASLLRPTPTLIEIPQNPTLPTVIREIATAQKEMGHEIRKDGVGHRCNLCGVYKHGSKWAH